MNHEDRPTCIIEGCGRAVVSKGRSANGERRWARHCWRHDGYGGDEPVRPKCQHPGCTNLAKAHSPFRYDRHCEKHAARPNNRQTGIERLRSSVCPHCGWSKTPLRRHLIMPRSLGGRYTQDNIVHLCANCRDLARVGELPMAELLEYSRWQRAAAARHDLSLSHEKGKSS